MLRSKGKWTVYKDLKVQEALHPYLLEAKLFSNDNLWAIIDNYQLAVIKPVYGEFGEDFIFITQLKKNVFKVCNTTHSRVIVGNQEVFQYIIKQLNEQMLYLVQQGVNEEKRTSEFVATRYYVELQKEWTSLDILNWKAGDRVCESIIDSHTHRELDAITLLVANQLKKIHHDCKCIIFIMVIDTREQIKIFDVFMPNRKSKLWQYQILLENKKIATFLPETRRLWKKSFIDMISKYNQVMIKPSLGFKGMGITQITRIGEDLFELISEGNRKVIIGTEEAFKSFDKYSGMYIIQQRIPLAIVDKCLFDFRVMVQKKDKEWIVIGILARVAYEGYVVTNIAKCILSYEEVLSKASISIDSNKLLDELGLICKLAAAQMDKFFNNRKIIGFDIAIDQHGTMWIIEANFNPDFQMFSRCDRGRF